MSFKLSEKAGAAWAFVVLILGIMGLGSWLVTDGHGAGWWLVILPLLALFFMSNKVTRMDLNELRAAVGVALEAESIRKDPLMTRICLSVGEYLKDAERWGFVMRNRLTLDDLSEMPPAQLQAHVDEQLRAGK